MKTSLDIIKYMYPTFGVAYHILMCKTNYRVSIHRSLRTKALINIKVTKLYAYFVQYLGSITLTRASKKMQKSKQEQQQQQLASHQCDRDSVMWSHISPAPRLCRACMVAPTPRRHGRACTPTAPPARVCRRTRDPAAAAVACARLCLWIPTSYFHLQLWFCQLLYTIQCADYL